MLLIGRVWVPYLSPQGKTAGAILENGDVIRVEPKVAAILKDRFVAGGNIAAEGTGVDTPLGKAIDAERIGDSIATLERLPRRASPCSFRMSRRQRHTRYFATNTSIPVPSSPSRWSFSTS